MATVTSSQRKLTHTSGTYQSSGNITVGGHIIVSGNVDGRDVASDGSKLDGIAANANNYSLPLASSSTRGGVKIGYSENGKNYPVELSSEKMYVNVPWVDTNTTYSVGDGGLTENNFTDALKNKLDGISAGADVTPTWVPSSNPSYATQSYVTTQINNLVDGAPAALNTLNELAAAIDDNSSYASSITSALSGKLGVSAKAADSNLLDGIDSSAFLRSNANDDFSGTLNYTPDTGTILAVDGQAILQRMTANGAITIGHDDAVIIAGGDTSTVLNSNINNAGETVFVGAEGGFIAYAFPNNNTAWSNRKELKWNGTDLSVLGYNVWHSNNDGSGSGLDADKLDGLHASSFNQVIGTDSDINTSGSTVIDQLNMTDGVIQSHSTRTLTLADLGYTGATNANNYSLPLASSSTRGGVKVGYSENGKNYPVELSSEKMYVNVPWVDTNTTYSVGDGGLTQNNFTDALKSKLNGIAANANNYSLPLASSSTRGGVKIGYSENGKNYPVELSSEKMYVNVPWTDTNTNTTYAAGSGLNLSSTTFSHSDTSSQSSINNSNGSVIQDVTLDTFGHVTGLSSTNLDSRYYTESEIQTFMDNSYISGHTASDLSVGWYTIATNTGDRATARFGIWDTDSSRHQSVTFYAAHKYGNAAADTITVLDNSYYGTSPLRYLRIKAGGTYDGAALQVYIDNAQNALNVAILGDNFQSSGWVLRDFIPDATTPPSVDNYGSFTESSRIDLDQIAQGGFATTGPIYADGDTTQYKVLTTNDNVNADTLDGNHGSHYLNYNNFTNTPTIPSAYSLPLATSSTRGGVKIGYPENGKNYPVELSSEKMYVNVPWVDTNTTYSVGDGGLTQKNFTSTLKSKLDGIATNANNYSLPLATSSTRGGVKIGYSENGKNYPVELSSEKMYVNVPWTDTNTTYSVGDGGLTQKNFTTTLKNKLDGIESGAKGDQTASEILTAIKTVDGSSSGLDADKLDGYHASTFYKSGSNASLADVTITDANSKIDVDGTYGGDYGSFGIGTTNLTNGHHRIFAKAGDHMYFAARSGKGFRFRPNGGSASSGVESAITSGGNFAIGTTTASSKLAVNGGVAIGASYTSSTAPTNGMLIQGNVGIGTSSVSGYYALQVNGSIQGSYKSFVIDHPTKENKQLVHASLEGPEIGVYFRGKSTSNTITMPDYWDGLVDLDSMTVELTAIGSKQCLFVSSMEANGDVVVGSNTDEPLNYYYVVYGERKDIDKLVIEVDVEEDDEEEAIADSPAEVDTTSVEYIDSLANA